MLNEIVDFLTQPHGNRGTYGWLYLMGLVVSAASILAAKEYAQRVARHKKGCTDALANFRTLTAHAITEQGGESKGISATLCFENNCYVLKLHISPDNDSTSTTTIAFKAWYEVESYLEQNSVLRVGDFKAEASPSNLP